MSEDQQLLVAKIKTHPRTNPEHISSLSHLSNSALITLFHSQRTRTLLENTSKCFLLTALTASSRNDWHERRVQGCSYSRGLCSVFHSIKHCSAASASEQSSRRTANPPSHTLNSSAAQTQQSGNAQVSQFARCTMNRMAVFIQVISGDFYRKPSRKYEMLTRCQKMLGWFWLNL